MTSDQVKLELPVGWGVLVDYLFRKMHELDVPEDKLIGARESGGYAVFFYALMPLKMFYDIRDHVYNTQIRSHKTCSVCGKYANAWSENDMPLCSDHSK